MTNSTQWVNEAWDEILKKVEKTSQRIGVSFPHASVEGTYDSMPARWWTAGFWPGLLWHLYADTKNETYKEIAEKCEEQLDPLFERFYTLSHDVGFQWTLTSIANYKLTGNEDSKRRALHAASILSSRFNSNGNFIRAWSHPGKEKIQTGWSIIDTMMNLPLLYWASKEIEDPRFEAVAIKHANTVLNHFIREDGAVHHIVEFDPITGEKVGCRGGQGYAPFSAWARGAAWAIYGLTLCYHHTGEYRYLQAAKKVANFFVANLEEDYVPVWDFRIPEDVTPYRDSSAGAIAASGMLLLSEKLDKVESKFYRKTAEKMLRSLYENYGAWDNDNEEGLILHGCSHYPNGKFVDNPLIYGDYFFVEGIARLRGSDLLLW